jgi:acyl-CoA synthetase (NDP forming)
VTAADGAAGSESLSDAGIPAVRSRLVRTPAQAASAQADVDEMLRSLRSYRLLTGYRQSPPLDVAAFAELLHRVSAVVEDIPEIAELDLNPVFVRQHGAVVADVRVRLTG